MANKKSNSNSGDRLSGAGSINYSGRDSDNGVYNSDIQDKRHIEEWAPWKEWSWKEWSLGGTVIIVGLIAIVTFGLLWLRDPKVKVIDKEVPIPEATATETVYLGPTPEPTIFVTPPPRTTTTIIREPGQRTTVIVISPSPYPSVVGSPCQINPITGRCLDDDTP